MELAMGAQRWCTGQSGLLPQGPLPNKQRVGLACANTAAIAASDTSARRDVRANPPAGPRVDAR